MSLPLTRRIARAALLVAAGAAPLVGAAGTAGAVEMPQNPVGGLSNVDGAGLGTAIDGTSQTTSSLVGEAGSNAISTAVPASGKTVGAAGMTAAPAATETAEQAQGNLGKVVGDVSDITEDGMPTDALKTQGLPTGDLSKNLPTDDIDKQLPTGQLTSQLGH
ncbi:ATP-binding protein [Streptomyces sp. URMC 123]|uniref:ATP-binding protein n=1 Tax=Streptomyces sp. URMC 123 TaxID=3423403 RepID=UPI003F1DA9ED